MNLFIIFNENILLNTHKANSDSERDVNNFENPAGSNIGRSVPAYYFVASLIFPIIKHWKIISFCIIGCVEDANTMIVVGIKYILKYILLTLLLIYCYSMSIVNDFFFCSTSTSKDNINKDRYGYILMVYNPKPLRQL